MDIFGGNCEKMREGNRMEYKSMPANERGSKGREKRRGRAMNGERKDGMDDRGMTHTHTHPPEHTPTHTEREKHYKIRTNVIYLNNSHRRLSSVLIKQ